MNKSIGMASPKKLVMVSDSVFLDHRQAARTAYLGMIDHIAERSGMASALVARTLHDPHASDRPDSGALYATAQEAVEFYLTKRTQATRPPGGLVDALTLVRNNLSTRTDDGRVTMVGVSGLPPAALTRYLGKTELRTVFDTVYGIGRSREDIAAEKAATRADDWIRPLSTGLTWPSPRLIEVICAVHHITPGQAILIGGSLNDEVAPALDLGMTAVYLRLGTLETPPTELDGLSPGITANGRRPDGFVTRIQDLPRLPLFHRADDNGPAPNRRPPWPIDRQR